MGSLLRAFLFSLRGKYSEIGDEEIEKAERAGEIAARNAAKRMGIVEQVEVDAEAARQAAQAKSTVRKDEERTN